MSIFGRGFTCKNASEENNRIIFTAASKRNCQDLENETTADERQVGGGGGGANKNGLSSLISLRRHCRPGILYQHISALLSLSTLLWLCSLSFSNMLSQNVSVASFFGGFSTGTLFFTKVSEEFLSILCKHPRLIFPALFTSFFISSNS